MSSVNIVLAHKSISYMEELQKNLNSNVYTVTQKSRRGVPLLRKIITKKPDIAIINYDLGDITAFDIIREARAKKVQTKFLVLYTNVNYNDVLVSKTLCINGNVSQYNSISKIMQYIDQVLKGGFIYSAFKGVVIEDIHLAGLASLPKQQLEICALLGMMGNMPKVAKKMSMELDSFKSKLLEIATALRFDKQQSFLEWCILKTTTIQNVAIKSF